MMRRNWPSGSASSRCSFAAGIKSKKNRFANALDSLPKQVLQYILDTVDVCNESDQPFDLLKKVLLGQSSWGKLKQHLPHGVSPDNEFFLVMFFICLPPSMRDAVGARYHKTAVTMVRATDALWDARGGRGRLLLAGGIMTEGTPMPAPKVVLILSKIFLFPKSGQ
jgi:hypothetical protein